MRDENSAKHVGTCDSHSSALRCDNTEDRLIKQTCADSSATDHNIEELVKRAQSGCSDAFGSLANLLSPRLVSFLVKRMGHLQDAEDVAAEALVKAWTHRSQYDSRYAFSTWVYTIARRLAIDHHRRKQSKPAFSSERELSLLADQRGNHATTICNQDSDSTDTNVWAIANKVLSSDQYSALWLHYTEDLSISDISRVLGKSNVGIRVCLHRARKALLAAIKRKRLD